MTKRELLAAIKTALLAETWAGGSNPVWGTGSVTISKAPELKTFLNYSRSPFAVIVPNDFKADPQWGEEPDLLVGTVIIRIGTVIPGDAVGENPLMGANRPDSTKSEGAGLYQIEVELFDAVGKMNVENGIVMQYRSMGDSGAILESNMYIAYEDHVFEAVCTAS